MKAHMDGSHDSVSTFLTHNSIGSDTKLALDIIMERIFWNGDGIRYASLRNAEVTTVRLPHYFQIDALAIHRVTFIFCYCLCFLACLF